ncbi:hypothetical protein [Lysinibacillus pakistanensis]|uniref:Uncharacterized protein n=1 Tax=Lysinibacillus pakistanensis TaxID=759811 RepID=A0AAX3WW41_9BACI|nr:hypothetical protein [Lysinibacillus pakistanensis]MDM5231494.1 hypothetical protein [Lysinibacillus pakistanensis]WHY47041.1 hypothetical protein QNH22_02135 [Lysinibacillus pakistanensis]WHY52052.1 hypothetical protein QNH24_02130 [Lysinibacillus pakistanensis]
MASLNRLASNWSRVEREKLNTNWSIIENYLSNLQGQINLLTGGVDVQELINQINDILNQGNVIIGDLETALQEATTVIANAQNATTDAQNAAQEALNAINDMQAFINQFGNAETYDNGKLYKANNIVEFNGSGFICVQDTQGNTPPTLPIKRNDWWQLIAQRGVDGTGSVSKVAGKSPELDGNVPLTAQDVGAASSVDFDKLFSLSPSVLKIPLASKYRGWQGVTVYNDLIYVVTDRNDNFALENIISVYTLDGKLVSEKRNAYTGLDPQGKFMSFGDINEIDGVFYATVYNLNDGGSPLVSRIIKFDPDTLDVLSEHEIGGNAAESVTKHDNAFWVAYHDIYTVRKFDLNFNFLQEYSLVMEPGYNQGGPQGSLWEGNYFYVNLHGTNFIFEEPFAELRKYQFDGIGFNFVEKINPPTEGCGQGLSKYGEYYFWNDRIRNHIVVSKKIRNGKVFPVTCHEGISFKPTLLSGWQGIGGDNNRSLRVTEVNSIIYLNGTLNNVNTGDWVYNGDGTNPICKIPPHLSPAYGFNFGALTNKGIVRISIVGPKTEYGILHPDKVGNIIPQDISGLNQGGLIEWVSLDGISYPI